MSEFGLGSGPDDERVVGDVSAPAHEPADEHAPAPRQHAHVSSRGGSRRAERARASRGMRGCLPLLVLAAVLVGAAWFGGGGAVDQVRSALGSSPDYSGPGTGSVTVEVHQGDTATAIGRTLESAGVVKSAGAFTDAAAGDSRSRNIQVGFYPLKKEMKASDALDVLVDPDNLIKARVTVTEGARVKDVVAAIAKNTDIPAGQVQAALKNPAALGLPPQAEGKIEGYLYPATYTVVPGETAKTLLSQMVAKTKQVQQEVDLAGRAQALGYTPEQVMTLASVLEYEGARSEDYPKIARVFYNRLAQGMPLQSDATVAYANNLSGTVWTTQEQRNNPSAYNTYAHTGLPPGPIGSPGKETLQAALAPAKGDWLYFVPVDLETGETAFASTYAEHQRNVAKLHAWCARTNSPNCG